MNEKSARTLELPKILERLASFTAFSASAELARALRPTPYLEDAQERQQATTEARLLLGSHPQTTVGGARDVRPAALSATRGSRWSRRCCSTSAPRCARRDHAAPHPGADAEPVPAAGRDHRPAGGMHRLAA